MWRDQHRRDTKPSCQSGPEQGAASSEHHEREVTRIEPAFDGDFPNGSCHGRQREFENDLRGSIGAGCIAIAQWAGDTGIDGASRCRQA
mgnify:CR=1 FL=1